jgi:hypothetical protein
MSSARRCRRQFCCFFRKFLKSAWQPMLPGEFGQDDEPAQFTSVLETGGNEKDSGQRSFEDSHSNFMKVMVNAALSRSPSCQWNDIRSCQIIE